MAFARDAVVLRPGEPGRGRASLRARSCPAYRRRGTGDARHAEDEGPRGARDRRDRVPRRAAARWCSPSGTALGLSSPPRCRASGRSTCGSSGRRTTASRSRARTATARAFVDLKGYDLDLWQHNATVIVPFLVSSRGYGILWDNTVLHALRRPARLGAHARPRRLLDATGQPGGLTGTYHAGAGFETLVATRVDPTIDDRSAGRREAAEPAHPPRAAAGGGDRRALGGRRRGDRDAATTCFQLYSNGGIRMWVDGRLVADHWRQGWLPWIDLARVPLEKGRHHGSRSSGRRTRGWRRCSSCGRRRRRSARRRCGPRSATASTTTSSTGRPLDRVVAGYRRLTGEAPMMPRWAFGLWQSRQRYETQQQSLDVVDGFRSRRIPFDNIVQDWFYWPENAWGSHRFDPARFPDPDGWVKAIHDRNARLMISVWGKFYPGTENFEALQREGVPLRAHPALRATRTGSARATPTPSTTPSTPRRGSSSGRR